MSVLYLKLLSLLFCAFLGFLGSRFLGISHRSIATLIVYIISPVFCFTVMATTPIPLSKLQIVPLYGAFCILTGSITFHMARRIFPDSRANLLALALCTPNLGYYGIPVVLVLYDDHMVALFMLFSLGVALSVYTFGFYIMNRTKYSIEESFSKFLRLPILYSIALGVAFSQCGFTLPEFLLATTDLFKGAYSLLGLMMIGLGFGSLSKFSLDLRFLTFLHVGKFVFYPLATILLLAFDGVTFNLFQGELKTLLLLSALMPVGINTINFSSLIGERTAEAATGVLLTTIVSTCIIPLLAGTHLVSFF